MLAVCAAHWRPSPHPLAFTSVVGNDLFEYIDTSTLMKLKEPQAALITEQLLSALSYLHGRGLVHRNVRCAWAGMQEETSPPTEFPNLVHFGFYFISTSG